MPAAVRARDAEALEGEEADPQRRRKLAGDDGLQKNEVAKKGRQQLSPPPPIGPESVDDFGPRY